MYVKQYFKGGWVNRGSQRDYVAKAPMEADAADAFVDYFYFGFSRTSSAASTAVATALGTAYKLVTVTEPNCNIGASPSPHEAVINDIDSVQDALVAMDATMTTANAAAVTFASGKIDYASAPV